MPSQVVHVSFKPLQARLLAALPASADKQRIVNGLGAAAMHHWKKLAQTRLRSTARDYVAGLQHHSMEDKAVIELHGEVPNMVEQGWKGGDMRDWLLHGPNAKMGKNGPYNIVPFRHGTPGTTERNVGSQMPKPIHDAAKRLTPTLSRPGKPVSTKGGRTQVYGERLHPGLPIKAAAKRILSRKEKPWHATSIYMSMIRKGKHIAGGKMQTTGYMTFRTISSKKRGDSHWVHPGITARNLAGDVVQHIGNLAGSIVRSATQ